MHLYAIKKASLLRRLFFCLLYGLTAATSLSSSSLALANCPADRIDQTARVSFIADGDTVKLSSGQWVRFIGINSPEKGRDGRIDEPLADTARIYLRELLNRQGMTISLRYGDEQRDRYGRLLAHPFLTDGSNLSEQLIAQGLGFQITVPPNVWGLDCYQAAEKQARQQQRGIWKEGWYAPRDSRSLPKNTRGFMRIRGKVIRIGYSKRSSWINLEGKVALRLDHKDKAAFTQLNLGSLVGKSITVRGWFYPAGKELRSNLRHPAAIESLN